MIIAYDESRVPVTLEIWRRRLRRLRRLRRRKNGRLGYVMHSTPTVFLTLG